MNTMFTSGQLSLLLKLWEEKGMTPDRLQVLLESGILADIFSKNAVLDRVAISLALDVAFPIHVVPRNLASLIEVGKYERTHRDITPDRFPIHSYDQGQFEAKLFCFKRKIPSSEVLVHMKCYGYEPSRIAQLLTFAISHPEEQLKYPIAALGSSTESEHKSKMPCITGQEDIRFLDLVSCSGAWLPHWRFLGIRKLS